MPLPDISVIIVSWNVKDLLYQCLVSLMRQTGVTAEIFVVDNASTDGTPAMVGQSFPRARLIVNDKNVGFAKANNQALNLAAGRYLLLLNPDTELRPDSLKQVVDFMEKHPRAAIAGCRLLNTDGTLQPSVRRFPTLVSQAWILLKAHHLLPTAKYWASNFNYHQAQEVDQVMGAFFMIRREAFAELGMLDENFFIWFEEVDYCRRAKNCGWQVWYAPVTEVTHHGGQSFNQLMSFTKQRMFNRSMLYYFKKHHRRSSWLILWLLSPASLALAWLYSWRVR